MTIVLRTPPRDAPHGARCNACCDWQLAILATKVGRLTPHGVALLYEEWLLWHVHVVIHQRMGASEGVLSPPAQAVA